MKTALLALTYVAALLLQLCSIVNGQSVSYVWDQVRSGNGTGNYGVKGIASPLNIPPGRRWASFATDTKKGILYVFGGMSRKLWKSRVS